MTSDKSKGLHYNGVVVIGEYRQLNEFNETEFYEIDSMR